MATAADIRWHQRLSNYQKALSQLGDGVKLAAQRPLSPIEQQGLIKSFEFTHELAWNVLKDFFENAGVFSIIGSRDATREAFQRNLITDGDTWMEMIKSRNQTTHTYNEAIAKDIVDKILSGYFSQFAALATKMQSLKEQKK